MNPSNMKRYNELLWLGVKKSKRDSVRGDTSTRYCDPSHVCMIQLTVPAWDTESAEVMPYETFMGDTESNFKIPEWNAPEEQVVRVPVEFLRQIVDEIGSDCVRLRVSTDFPLIIEWKDGDDRWKAWIAPRIDSD